MAVEGDVRAFDALSRHPRIGEIAAIARDVLVAGADAHRIEAFGDGGHLAIERGLPREEAATELGNALDVLGRGPATPDERHLARALAAHAMAVRPPADAETARTEAQRWLWLAAHTPFDALALLDAALGGQAALMNAAVNDAVRAGLAEVLGPVGRRRPLDPVRGQIASRPRGPVATALLGLTGLLLLAQAARLFGRWALSYRAPAEVAMAEDGGVRVHWRIELLGRTLRDRDVLVPRASLARATREVRFSGAALYAALLSLAIGSYLGVSTFVDGARAASPALLATGLAVVAAGLALDFVFSCLLPGARGRCRMVLVPRRGPPLCVGEIDRSRADAFLGALGGPSSGG
ncbi:MAG TPA: hypothetical protein VHV30_02505 [Polyangiaceae bacterium]|jgi:hypothetical protein|nr:hypothetical protein [Polyangiaceae bacterium]